MTNEKRMPYLVQRMRRRDNGARKGIDALFGFDYMGAAEFEFGALGRALAVAREKTDTGPAEIAHGKHAVWFVGGADDLTTAKALFADQITSGRKVRLKESTYIRESVAGTSDWFDDVRDWQKFDGWWAIDSCSAFTLFRTKTFADEWLAALGLASEPRR
jgi:hypothetical protein